MKRRRESAYSNQLLENGLEVLQRSIVEWIDGFRALVSISMSLVLWGFKTYREFPFHLPQGLHRSLMRVDGVEFVSKNPGRHFDSDTVNKVVCVVLSRQ